MEAEPTWNCGKQAKESRHEGELTKTGIPECLFPPGCAGGAKPSNPIPLLTWARRDGRGDGHLFEELVSLVRLVEESRRLGPAIEAEGVEV